MGIQMVNTLGNVVDVDPARFEELSAEGFLLPEMYAEQLKIRQKQNDALIAQGLPPLKTPLIPIQNPENIRGEVPDMTRPGIVDSALPQVQNTPMQAQDIDDHKVEDVLAGVKEAKLTYEHLGGGVYAILRNDDILFKVRTKDKAMQKVAELKAQGAEKPGWVLSLDDDEPVPAVNPDNAEDEEATE